MNSQLPLLAVLMAGGGGTRFWPLSRPGQPKQFLPLIGGRSLFQLTVARLREILPPENIFVISNEQLMPMIRSSHAGLPEREPAVRTEPAQYRAGRRLCPGRPPDPLPPVCDGVSAFGPLHRRYQTVSGADTGSPIPWPGKGISLRSGLSRPIR